MGSKRLNKCKIVKNESKKGTIGVYIKRVARGGKISFSEGGGGINIVLVSKYRPLR
jgi:hypothetical protein